MVTQVTKSIDDCLLEARAAVNDNQAPFRNPDTTLLEYLNTALRTVYALRPDAYVGNFTQGILTSNAANTYSEGDLGLDPATPFPLDDRLFYAPVIFYIAGRIELADDEFTDTARSQQLMMAFVTQLQGMP